MAVDYKIYLAENVLSERRVVTYRLLSRALKVHSNLAKQMLFDFHKTENGKKPSSVSATYLISGIQAAQKLPAANGESNDREDTAMRSSPYMSSMPQSNEKEPSMRTTSFVLAREEDLDDAKATFESISMIHIYSLQSNELPDLNALVDVNREILSTFGSEDPLELGRQWGMIQNQNVKRRKLGKPPPPVVAPTVPKAAEALKKDVPKKEAAQPKNEPEVSSRESAQQKAQPKTTEKAPARRKGDLFSSFANAKPKLKKEDSAASSVKSTTESVPKKGMFDDDDDAEAVEEEEPFSNSKESKPMSNRESRKEREAKLKQMMEDDDDEDMPDATETPVESAAEEPQQTEPPKAPEPEPKETVTVQGGRRRGKRKIMKKKTVKDDEGYLVTVEEPAWESFSEDEPAPPPKKKAAVSATGKKAGQGNIMSFFSKK
ncbi:hypothetical protein TMatcc_002583 [Talaromyces marneffei ATCC 18224]|uniref:DNA polymerase delta subunit 3 n=1 Tax=Talaromyces marneffei (strain ATCC 18224 / CBS 334.59 / QM 7333) TaxID=441960 RepID=B6Q2V4_TALMQ|nr:conserved hypothetical protein [Talaromyces marneffei ATCC 18224]KAE8555351.1 hypothetical protein EYB25_000046 [Talaromyces marneffei]